MKQFWCGPATGVGATVILVADIRPASEISEVGFLFNRRRRRVLPESCSAWFLPGLVGMQTAMEWVLTGRVFAAPEALDGGLIRRLHTPEGFASFVAKRPASFTDRVSAGLPDLFRSLPVPTFDPTSLEDHR